MNSSSITNTNVIKGGTIAAASIVILGIRRYNNRRSKQTQPQISKRSGTWRMLRYMEPVELLQTGIGIICAGLYSVTTMDLARDVETALDSARNQTLTSHLPSLTSQFIRRALYSEVFNTIYICCIRWAGHRMAYRLRKDSFAVVCQQPPKYFDQTPTGELISLLLGDGSGHISRFPESLARGLQHALFLVRGLYAMYGNNSNRGQLGRLAGELIAIIGSSVVFVMLTRPYTKRRRIMVQQEELDCAGFAEERLSGVRTVQAFNRESRDASVMGGKLRQVYNAACSRVTSEATQTAVTQLSGYLGLARILFVCGAMCNEGTLTVGGLMAFSARTLLVVLGTRGLLQVSRNLTNASIYADRLFSILDDHKTVISKVKTIALDNTKLEGSITINNAHLSYPLRPDVQVWSGLTINIQQGSKVAIVGASGSGKTSVALVLLKMYSLTEGQVLIGNKDISTMDTEWLRSHIGYVAQEPTLFQGTIAENIAYGLLSSDSKINMEIVQAAAVRASVHEFIMSLPLGYDTPVGPKGTRLSGGQRQRICIARALIRSPTILILDEATASLDIENEIQVQKAIDNLIKDTQSRRMTVIVIGHRLTSIHNVDKILVLSNGKLAEEGTYDELINTKNSHFQSIMKTSIPLPSN